MKNKIQLDSYWFESKNEDNKKVMSVMCTECFKKNNIEAMFWNGRINGYGNYDCKCKLCDKIINQRGTE